MSSFPVPLVCPRCRVPGPSGELPVVLLEPRDDHDRCPGCLTEYPRIAGSIRCVSPDPDEVLVQQRWACGDGWLPSADDAETARALCDAASTRLDPLGEAFREVALTTLYARAHYPTGAFSENTRLFDRIAGWLADFPPPAELPCRAALEVGCGAGGLLRRLDVLPDGVIGFDLRVSMLRVAQRMASEGEIVLPFRVEGRRFESVRLSAPPAPGRIHLIQGDITAPPFVAESFPAIAAISVLDAVPDPLFALGQIDALLAPGGLLVLAAPYHFEAFVTPPEHWWGDERSTASQVLRATIAGESPVLPHLSYEILAESEEPFTLPGDRRVEHRYSLDVLVLRKR